MSEQELCDAAEAGNTEAHTEAQSSATPAQTCGTRTIQNLWFVDKTRSNTHLTFKSVICYLLFAMERGSFSQVNPKHSMSVMYACVDPSNHPQCR